MKKMAAVLMIILSFLCSTIISSAAVDPAVVLVNPAPNSTVDSNNLLISVKLTQPRIIKVTVFEEKQMVNGTLSAINVNTVTTSNGTISSVNMQSVAKAYLPEFTSSNNLSFYTQQINNLTPGLYRIQIDTLDGNGKKLYERNSYVAVKEKAEEEEKLLETPQSGTMQFLQNLLNTIFGN